MARRPSAGNSFETLCHAAGPACFLLNFHHDAVTPLEPADTAPTYPFGV